MGIGAEDCSIQKGGIGLFRSFSFGPTSTAVCASDLSRVTPSMPSSSSLRFPMGTISWLKVLNVLGSYAMAMASILLHSSLDKSGVWSPL